MGQACGQSRGNPGGILSFSPEAAVATIDSIRDVIGGRRAAGITIDDDILRRAAPLFSSAWLMDVLPKAMGQDEPILQNGDDEEVVFNTIRFPLAASFTQKVIGARLDEIEGLLRESTSFWNWLGGLAPKKPAAATAPNAIAWSVTMDDGSLVLGNVELKGRVLSCTSVRSKSSMRCSTTIR